MVRKHYHYDANELYELNEMQKLLIRNIFDQSRVITRAAEGNVGSLPGNTNALSNTKNFETKIAEIYSSHLF